MHKWMDGWMDEWVNGCMHGWMDHEWVMNERSLQDLQECKIELKVDTASEWTWMTYCLAP